MKQSYVILATFFCFATGLFAMNGNLPPVAVKPIGNVEGLETDADTSIDLSSYFTDPDDTAVISFEIVVNSDSSVVIASIAGSNIVIDFISQGQSNITVKALSAGQSVIGSFVAGVSPVIEGDYAVSDFEDLTLDHDSYWNGSDGSGGYVSGSAFFPNYYDAIFYSWSGWAYSNTGDDSTMSYSNQYSAITASGIDTLSSGGRNYGVSYVLSDFITAETIPVPLDFIDYSAHEVKGFFVTNSTYAALILGQGDAFAKKFGGDSGNDPDWFKLSVWGLLDSIETDTVEFYLADYRFDDNSKDYIIKTWQWVELSSLGKVDSLIFDLSSSDAGMWGMNTPAYFCVDNIYMNPGMAPSVENPLSDVLVYENAADYVIDLSDVFTDPDTEDTAIVKTVKHNSNTALVDASVTGDSLTLSFTAGSTGQAEVVIEGRSGILAVTDTFLVVVSPLSGIYDAAGIPLSVFPNPSDGKFRINEDTGTILGIMVYGLDGIMVCENKNYAPQQLIDISDMPAGSYIIKIQKGQTIVSRVLIKQ